MCGAFLIADVVFIDLKIGKLTILKYFLVFYIEKDAIFYADCFFYFIC